MKWLEIIKVQGAATDFQGAGAELMKQIGGGASCPGLKGFRVYVHASVPEDLMIRLSWDNASPRSWGSPMAQNLARELKQFGLVDHSVWIEKFPEFIPVPGVTNDDTTITDYNIKTRK
jgi:hypothetical protein